MRRPSRDRSSPVSSSCSKCPAGRVPTCGGLTRSRTLRPETGEVEFLIKTIGPGTAALEELPEGAPASLLGPLGNAFSLDGLARGSRVAVVAGGIGAAPFPLLYRALGEAGVAGDLFLGGAARGTSPSARASRVS
jgi:NAD(P)H-flavin reductase